MRALCPNFPPYRGGRDNGYFAIFLSLPLSATRLLTENHGRRESTICERHFEQRCSRKSAALA